MKKMIPAIMVFAFLLLFSTEGRCADQAEDLVFAGRKLWMGN
jgi:hypothetical protein